MKLISWNVNGIRAILKKDFMKFLNQEDPDILCLQETKIHYPHPFLNLNYKIYWSFAEKKGYSGTAIFTKKEPLSVSYLPDDKEGRVVALEFKEFFIVNVYVPNSQRGLTRLDYRQEWNSKFLKFLKELEKQKPVICCGDFNVSHKEIDLARPKNNRKNAGFTDEERTDFTKLLDTGFIDTFRLFNQEPDNYTWWSYMHNAREKNIGWRLDYFIASEKLKPKLKSAGILNKVIGSDHCPVSLILK